jgi:hypothetical protein
MAQHRTRSSVDVVISHPQKVLFPDDGISKGELAAYYERVAPLMLCAECEVMQARRNQYAPGAHEPGEAGIPDIAA